MNKKKFIAPFQTASEMYAFFDSIPAFQTSGLQAAHMGLAHFKTFCEAIDNPQKNIRMIHVAGTNGKGSVTAMLASVYAKAGYKTGMYTSPHLVHLSERIRVNGLPISDESLLRFFSIHAEIINTIQYSYFELLTAIAFWHFSESKVDIAIIETGLGGRLDATNIIAPLASVITTVSLDHSDYLGSDLKQIAFEKAGIIKENVPVIVGNVDKDVRAVITNVARSKNAQVIDASEYLPSEVSDGFELHHGEQKYKFELPLVSKAQQFNIASSMAALETCRDYLNAEAAHITAGISSAFELLPGRMEKLHPELNWYFDGAHNIQAIESLIQTISDQFKTDQITIIFNIMKDKANESLLSEFKVLNSVYYAETKNPRAAKFDSIRKVLPFCNKVSDETSQVISLLEKLKSELVIFTGSFYFYGVVRKWMENLPGIQT